MGSGPSLCAHESTKAEGGSWKEGDQDMSGLSTSECQKKLWADPEHRKKMMASKRKSIDKIMYDRIVKALKNKEP